MKNEMIWAVVSPVNPLIENGNGLLTATRLPSISIAEMYISPTVT